MAEVTATLVKELREKTGAGMMDSKKALVETGGDIEAAVDWLRAKGLSKAAKKAGRVAADGLVGVALRTKGKSATGAVVEVNSETDFVARTETFQGFVREAAQAALVAKGDVAKTLAGKTASGETIEGKLTGLIATIGENMAVRRAAALSAEPGVVAAYVHNQAGEGVGKIGVLVALKSEGDPGKLGELGRKIAMHIAAASPHAALSTRVEDLDPAVVARERAIFATSARESGKPENIIEKMVDGRMRKFYEEFVLLEQVFVIDGENKVKVVVENAAKELGVPIVVTGFVRMALGEGVDKSAAAAEGG
jgi:elongation factor Ts